MRGRNLQLLHRMFKIPRLVFISRRHQRFLVTSVSLLFVILFLWRYKMPDEDLAFYSSSTQHKCNHYEHYIISSICNCGKSIARRKSNDENEDSEKFHWCSPESSVRGKHQKIITYSLFGNASNNYVFQRFYSLLKNISLTAKNEYPGWTVRIYHNFRDTNNGSTIDVMANDFLCDVYCRFQNVDLCSLPNLVKRIISVGKKKTIDPVLIKHLNPRMFRFLVMFDPDVDVFISRDVDSIIWPREIDAVNEWLRSNYTFHVMRDHVHHGQIVLAGTLNSI